MSRYILALDQGTTSSRAILFNEKAQIVGIAQREFTQIYPQAGWVEHNPDEIWDTQLATAQQVLTQHGRGDDGAKQDLSQDDAQWAGTRRRHLCAGVDLLGGVGACGRARKERHTAGGGRECSRTQLPCG